jgi:hypothetical protein
MLTPDFEVYNAVTMPFSLAHPPHIRARRHSVGAWVVRRR